MTISDWLIIIAMLIAPLLAVQTQKFIENKKEKKERKIQIFRTLMTTRANPLSPQHVEALNMIDIEFYDNEKVVDANKLLLDSFNNYPRDTKVENYQIKLDACVEKSKDLLIDLLHEMANSLNYSFDKVHLKRGAYIPKGHTDYMLDQEIIRRALVGVLLGQIPIPIKVVNVKETEKKEKPSSNVLPNSIPPQN